MEQETYITLAIHTYDKAVIVKQMLENNGIEVKLQNVNLLNPSVFPGVRVRIKEKDLSIALELVERAQNFSSNAVERKPASGIILIPVDFSDNSLISCRIGFEFASMLSMRPLLIHAYMTQYFNGSFAFSGLYDETRESELNSGLERQAKMQMQSLSYNLKKMIAAGELPDLDFSTDVVEGVPEEVILEYSRTYSPALIVMATRGKNKREQELIGSVTAEVIDSCRVPVFTVPENCSISSDFSEPANVAFFCNLSQHDMLSMDAFIRLFNYKKFVIDIVPVNERIHGDVKKKVDVLTGYFRSTYPESKFDSRILPEKSFRVDFEKLVEERNIGMLIVPNKKKSVFSRLFNPGIAHKILFERDIPMLVLPV